MTDQYDGTPDSEQEPAAASDLIRAASAWAQDALSAIHDEADHRAAVAGPMAVELLGKAVLWRTNPLLVVAPELLKDSASVVKIAGDPDLRGQRMKTIYLAEVLKRIAILLGGLPLDQKKQDRLCDTRNGGAHAGLPGPSRQALEDSLSVLDALLAYLDMDPDEFYGDLASTAAGLRAEYRDAIDAHVQLESVMGAWVALQKLRKSLGDAEFEDLCRRRYEATDEDLAPENFGAGFFRTPYACPACSEEGRLFGSVEVDDRVEYDHEKVGPGDYEAVPYVSLVPSLIPEVFACNVCKLVLRSAAELAAADLPDTRFEVSEGALGPDFDAAEAAASESGWRD
ncbi:hypothetical protein [Nocardioides sp. REDSEA-S30_B4]|uniref:hypothetical protein n=1 Tax=Nocardioides sp. REDSEA-S30_B4 TaxID=1811552 RepID=UPI000A7EDCCD|nr:hypothetical protein [Nocardioides sp. REDSEA-S30_B4]